MILNAYFCTFFQWSDFSHHDLLFSFILGPRRKSILDNHKHTLWKKISFFIFTIVFVFAEHRFSKLFEPGMTTSLWLKFLDDPNVDHRNGFNEFTLCKQGRGNNLLRNDPKDIRMQAGFIYLGVFILHSRTKKRNTPINDTLGVDMKYLGFGLFVFFVHGKGWMICFSFRWMTKIMNGAIFSSIITAPRNLSQYFLMMSGRMNREGKTGPPNR